MAFKNQHRKEKNKEKKTYYPRIHLNIKNNYHSISFQATCPILSNSEYQRYKAENKIPAELSIPILMKDLRTILFKSNQKIYIHNKVSKFLLTNKRFMRLLSLEIENSQEQISKYEMKLENARTQRSIDFWFEKEKEESNRLYVLEDLKKSLLKYLK